MGTEKQPGVITLRDVRASFLTLGEPERFQNKPENKPRWSATGLVAYADAQIKTIDALIEEVAAAKWEKKWKSYLENIVVDPKACFKVDGKRKDYAGYEGMWALTAHRDAKKGRPLVLDTDKSPIYLGRNADASKGESSNDTYVSKAGRIYSGCYVNMQIQIWAQDNAQGKGIRAELLGVQRVKDGDAFSGGAAPDESAFEEITDGADSDDLT